MRDSNTNNRSKTKLNPETRNGKFQYAEVDFATKSKIVYSIPIVVDTTTTGDDVNFITLEFKSQEFQLTECPQPENITNDISSYVSWNTSIEFTSDGTWDKANFIIPNNFNSTSPSGKSKLNVETLVDSCGGNTSIRLIVTIDVSELTYLTGIISARLADIYPGNQTSIFHIEKIDEQESV